MMEYLTMSTSGSGSDTLSGSVGCSAGFSGGRALRVRTVRLVRPCAGGPGALPAPGLTCRHGPGLGFSVRGGREHGTGFFVSGVDAGSEAHRQGLRVGDQIIRINGFTVEDAVHKEVIQLISNHTHLTLKVRSVGMIPVKDKSTDPLSWQIIPDYPPSISESPPLEDKTHHHVRINIAVAQRAKLGCGICKGPEWKQGIFVQFTKEGGIARDAGLRPGDQIISCNSVDFTDISFNEAVNIMKTSRQLELIIRKGAGSELFPNESSGYNSSASSVTGDQSPSWSETKRLSIVKEESLDLSSIDRLSHLEGRYKPKPWDKLSYDWDESPRHYKPTIINLSENGISIRNNGTDNPGRNHENEEKPRPGSKIADISMMSHQPETKTVVVEVHRSEKDDKIAEDVIKKSPSTTSFGSLASRSSNASSSLSSAITMELQRRSERMKETEIKTNIEEEIQKKKILKGVDSDKKHQHDKLMDEFKKAHRRMFNSSLEEKEKDVTSIEETVVKEKIAINKESTITERQTTCQYTQKLSEIRQKPQNEETEFQSSRSTPSPVATSISPARNGCGPPPPPPFHKHSHEHKSNPSRPMHFQNGRMPSQSPPPPPPSTFTATNTETKTPPKTSIKPKAPPVPPQKNKRSQSPPPCPTPDYDTLSLSSNTSSSTLQRHPKATFSQNGDTVDMESLESYKLNNPNSIPPRPPSTYFPRPKAGLSPQSSNSSQGSQTLKKTRPVSVTIGEYPTGTVRKQPTKFDFLQNGGDDHNDGVKEPITSRLASELAQTLSRSNLRNRTESMENLLNGTTNPKNNSVTISVNNLNGNNNNTIGKLQNPFFLNNGQHKTLTKSQSATPSTGRQTDLAAVLSNRVTIKIPEAERRIESPNGILKNGNVQQ